MRPERVMTLPRTMADVLAVELVQLVLCRCEQPTFRPAIPSTTAPAIALCLPALNPDWGHYDANNNQPEPDRRSSYGRPEASLSLREDASVVSIDQGVL
jgi:hypothetical protein